MAAPKSFWEAKGQEIVDGLDPWALANSGDPDAYIRQEIEKAYSRLPAGQKKAYESGDTDEFASAPGTPEYIEEKTLKLAEDTRKENKAIWADLANLPLNELASRLGISNQEAQAAHDKFVDAVNAYQTPEVPAELAAIESEAAKAAADPLAIAAQREALGKAGALTGIEETAEERFMREQARRKQERDLRGQREADRNSLLARGAYGSGAEIAMNANAQQEAAERRSLEELGANANAQQRALAAIGRYGDIAGNMRQQSFGEASSRGSAADTVRNWNRQYSEDHRRFEREQRIKDEDSKVQRAGLVRQSEADKTRDADTRAGALWGAKVNLAEGMSGENTSGAGQVAGALSRTGTRLYNDQIRKDMDDDESFNLINPTTWF